MRKAVREGPEAFGSAGKRQRRRARGPSWPSRPSLRQSLYWRSRVLTRNRALPRLPPGVGSPWALSGAGVKWLLPAGHSSASSRRSSPIIVELDGDSNPRLGLSCYALQPSARVGGGCLGTPVRLTMASASHQVPGEVQASTHNCPGPIKS